MVSLKVSPEGAKKVAIVFVHLGKNPSPTLISSAKYARITNPNARVLLLTDRIKDWKAFPGEVIAIKDSQNRNTRHIVKGASYLEKIAGGYWVNTYERIFVLSQLEEILDLETLIVHIESDVLIQDEKILQNALSGIELKGIGVPRMNENQGIASILISPNFGELNKALSLLKKLAIKYPEKCSTDMNLLGLALNLGIISELPTWKSQNSIPDGLGNYFLFEGAAVGQYLFGLDPIHTKNIRVSGFENPTFPVKLSNLKWATQENAVYAYEGQQKYWFTNLHIHSKEVLCTPLEDPVRWSEAISEANMEVPRKFQENIPEVIHSSGYSLLVKAQIFFRNRV